MSTCTPVFSRTRRREHGAVLIVCLLLLLVLTILGVTTMRASTFEERMAGNARDLNLSFQASEAGLRAAELGLLTQTSRGRAPYTCATLTCDLTDNVFDAGVLPVDLKALANDLEWWEDHALVYGEGTGPTVDDDDPGAGAVAHVSDPPRTVVEQLRIVPDTPEPDSPVRVIYRVSSRAAGGSDVAATILESTYALVPP